MCGFEIARLLLAWHSAVHQTMMRCGPPLRVHHSLGLPAVVACFCRASAPTCSLPKGLAEDKKFLANLDTNCALKKKEWAAYKEMQGTEALALADTIKVLNDVDLSDLVAYSIL